jgi:hypothetical protein
MLDTIRDRNDGEVNAGLHFAYGKIAQQLPADRRAVARRRLEETESARTDGVAVLTRDAALAMASGGAPTGALRERLHENLTSLDYDHDYTVRNIRIALRVAELMPELVDADDLIWLTRFPEHDVRKSAHALLERLRKPMPAARAFDRRTVKSLDDAELVALIGDAHVVGRAALIAEADRRSLDDAREAIIRATNEVIDRAPEGGANLLDHESHVLEAAVQALRDELDDATTALFDRMLRHSNFHVKWELLQDPPPDDRLIGGMFVVLGQRWGWQEKTAKEWLEQFAGTPAYEEARKHAGSPPLADDNEDDIDDEDDDDIEDDDDGMN